MNSNASNSRRNFLKKAGGLTIGMAGISAIASNLPSELLEKKKPVVLFTTELSGTKDRIERVKIATLGMQRYDWEQGTVAQAFLEMGEDDLVISLARGAILRQEKGRFSVLKGNGPINDCAS